MCAAVGSDEPEHRSNSILASLPTEADINIHDSLDERSAVEHFLGKDLNQAEALFHENFICYQKT